MTNLNQPESFAPEPQSLVGKTVDIEDLGRGTIIENDGAFVTIQIHHQTKCEFMVIPIHALIPQNQP